MFREILDMTQHAPEICCERLGGLVKGAPGGKMVRLERCPFCGTDAVYPHDRTTKRKVVKKAAKKKATKKKAPAKKRKKAAPTPHPKPMHEAALFQVERCPFCGTDAEATKKKATKKKATKKKAAKKKAAKKEGPVKKRKKAPPRK